MNIVEQTIQSRKTSKVLLPVELRHEQQALWREEHTEVLHAMLNSAAWAPFHKRAHADHCESEMNAPMPWRFHVVNPAACTKLLVFLENQANAHTDSKWSRAWQSKIKEMVSACGVLVQATWLPDPAESADGPTDAQTPAFNQKNVEHVAAASSAVQSLLLAAQSHDWLSYWSSGGILRDEETFDYMGINRREKLLGSVFLSPQAHTAARIIDGGLREQRGDLAGWVNWV
ncbi:MAG: hypothetical protein AB8B87_14640 [Granulosicoccus sp.]